MKTLASAVCLQFLVGKYIFASLLQTFKLNLFRDKEQLSYTRKATALADLLCNLKYLTRFQFLGVIIMKISLLLIFMYFCVLAQYVSYFVLMNRKNIVNNEITSLNRLKLSNREINSKFLIYLKK